MLIVSFSKNIDTSPVNNVQVTKDVLIRLGQQCVKYVPGSRDHKGEL